MLTAPYNHSFDRVSFRLYEHASNANHEKTNFSTHLSHNESLGAADMDKYCPPDTEAQNSARSALGGLGLSVGSYHCILKIARTIADLAHEEDITAEHLNEAIQYRRLVFEGFAA